MNCQQAHERIYDLVTGNEDYQEEAAARVQLDPDLRQHLDSCQECKSEYEQLEEAWASIALSADAKRPPEGLEASIMERVHESTRPLVTNAAPDPRATLSSPMRFLSYAVAASVLFVLVGGQVYYLNRISSITMASRDPDTHERLQSLENAVAELERLQAESQGVPIQFVSFERGAEFIVGEEPKAAAHAIWSGSARQLHFFGFDLGTLERDQTFAVWFAEGEQAVLAHTFQPDAKSRIEFVLTAPKGIEPTKILMTVESLPVGETPSDVLWSFADLKSEQ